MRHISSCFKFTFKKSARKNNKKTGNESGFSPLRRITLQTIVIQENFWATKNTNRNVSTNVRHYSSISSRLAIRVLLGVLIEIRLETIELILLIHVLKVTRRIYLNARRGNELVAIASCLAKLMGRLNPQTGKFLIKLTVSFAPPIIKG